MLVTTDWLAKNLSDPNLRIVDCRYVLGKPGAGSKAYAAGHIPGALHLDVDRDLSRLGGVAGGGPGRHPLPRTTEFATTMSRAGIDQQINVVVYDDAGGAYAARLWWLLQYFGHEKVLLLDGGWTKWIAEKRPISKEEPVIKARSFKAAPHRDWVVDKGYIAGKVAATFLLLDARAPDRFCGEVEPIDPKAGHIPGAKNAPFASNLEGASKEFKSPEKLREQFSKLGAEFSRGSRQEIICYCGSGVTACHNIFALKLAGWEAKLYEGSWSDWSSDPNLPIAK